MWSTSRTSASSSMRPAGTGVLVQERADRVGDLAPAAVPDRHVDHHPAGTVGGRRLGRLERGGGRRRQDVERADRAQLPRVSVGGQVPGQILDDPQQRIEFGGRPAQVLGAEQVERDVPDTGLVTPARARSLIFDSADAVAVVRVDVAHLPRPPAVAVAHQPDVVRMRLARERGDQPPLVDRINQIPHVSQTIHRARPGHGPSARTDSGAPDEGATRTLVTA